MSVPELRGTMHIAADGTIIIDAETLPMTAPLIPGNLFTLYDFYVIVGYYSGPSSTSTTLLLDVGGDVLIGGPNGFLASVSGALNTGSGEASLTISHAGGWSPLPGALGDLFRTPSINGWVYLNHNGTYLQLGAVAEFTQPIKVLPGVLELTGYPPFKTAQGPSLGFDMRRETKLSDALFEVRVLAALRIGSGSGAPPLIMMNGTFRSCGGSHLYIATETAWQPLPSALPGLQIPRIWGDLNLEDSGRLTAEVSHDPLPDIDLGGVLGFTGWQAHLFVEARPSVLKSTDCAAAQGSGSDNPPSKANVAPTPAPSSPPTYSTDVEVHVSGGIVIGGELEFDVTGTIVTATQTVEISIIHPGGWCPFSFLSGFCTPRIEGLFYMSSDPNAEAYLRMSAMVTLGGPLPIVPGIVEIGCFAQGCSDGPEFGVSMTQASKTAPRYFSAFFRGNACLKLTSSSYCMLVTVSADAVSSRRRLSGEHDQLSRGRGGNHANSSRSFSAVDVVPSLVERPDEDGVWRDIDSELEGVLANGSLISAAPARQLAATKGSSKKGLQFTGFTILGQLVSGDLKPLSVIPFLFFMEDLIVIRATWEQPLSLSLTILPGAPVKIGISAVISINLPSFLGLPSIDLPVEVEGSLPGPKAVFKTPELPALDLGIFKFEGLRLMMATGSSVMVTLKSGTQFPLDEGFALVYEGASPIPAMCPLSMVLIFQMPSIKSFRFEGLCTGFSLMMLHKAPLTLPSINFLRFDSISIFAGVAPGLVEFGVGTTFDLATGISYCNDPLEAECIKAAFSVWIGIIPGKMIVGFALPTSGIWIEPLGLRNFAVINPSIEIELEITLSIPPVPTPRKVAWAITILYKMPWLAEWPDELRYREAPHPAYYRPDLTPWTSGDGPVRQLSVFFLYEQWHSEIDDLLCSITGLPRFAIKVVVPKLSFIQLFLMFADIVFSAVSAASQQDVRTPPAVASLLAALDDLLKIEMSFYLELSLIQSEAVPEWSGEPVERGLYLNSSVHVALFGFQMDLRCEAKLRIPTPDAAGVAKVASGFSKFFSNPMGIITGEVSAKDLGIDAGIMIEAHTILPLGMGEAYFMGKISFDGFELRAFIDFQVGPFTLDVTLEFLVRINIIQLEFYANVEFGPFGTVSVYGLVTSSPPSFMLNGTLCANLVGFRFSGFVMTYRHTGSNPPLPHGSSLDSHKGSNPRIPHDPSLPLQRVLSLLTSPMARHCVASCAGGDDCPADGFFAFHISAYIGFLGTVAMGGQIAASGSGVSVRGVARLELDFAELAAQLVDVVVYIIAGSSNPAASLVATGLKWLFGLLDFLKLVEIAYDSDAGEISTRLTLNIPFVGGREFGPFTLPLPVRRQQRQLEELPGWPSSDDLGREATHHRALQSADYCDNESPMTLKDMVKEVQEYFRNPGKLFASLGPVEFEFEFEAKAFIVGVSGAVRFNMTTEGEVSSVRQSSTSRINHCRAHRSKRQLTAHTRTLHTCACRTLSSVSSPLRNTRPHLRP